MIKIGSIPKKGACPRCGSTRVYRSPEEFICLTCSLIVLPRLHYKLA